jgi:agmatine deiminase
MYLNNKSKIFFPPEWFEQDGVILTWPHAGTDWAPILYEVESTYTEVAKQISKREKLIIISQDVTHVKSLFSEEESGNFLFFEIPSNDTWARDHGPICTYQDDTPAVNDFRFNGWGNRFESNLDNQITASLMKQNAFIKNTVHHSFPDFILEGGSIESDGLGTILTTSKCLLNPNRNGNLTKKEIEDFLKNKLGTNRILWLDFGFLEGDDTDSHIDTLARFCDEETICYVQCDDEQDLHYAEFRKMEKQIKSFRTIKGKPYRLIPLPMARPLYDPDGHRMPATYANFLIINKSVLVPMYGTDNDEQAMETIREIFHDREIKGINCVPLIRQNGSLHCITMQIPKGFLR